MDITIETEPRNGFVNLSLNKQGHTIADWSKLESDDVDSITSYEITRYVNLEQLKNVLANWKSKIKPMGTVRLSFLNPNAIAREVRMGNMQLQDIHGLVLKNHLLSTKDALDAFKSSGLKIDVVSFDGIWTTIEGEKE